MLSIYNPALCSIINLASSTTLVDNSVIVLNNDTSTSSAFTHVWDNKYIIKVVIVGSSRGW
jgi:hypothetical protein